MVLIELLPENMLSEITGYITHRDLMKFIRVNKYLYKLRKDMTWNIISNPISYNLPRLFTLLGEKCSIRQFCTGDELSEKHFDILVKLLNPQTIESLYFHYDDYESFEYFGLIKTALDNSLKSLFVPKKFIDFVLLNNNNKLDFSRVEKLTIHGDINNNDNNIDYTIDIGELFDWQIMSKLKHLNIGLDNIEISNVKCFSSLKLADIKIESKDDIDNDNILDILHFMDKSCIKNITLNMDTITNGDVVKMFNSLSNCKILESLCIKGVFENNRIDHLVKLLPQTLHRLELGANISKSTLDLFPKLEILGLNKLMDTNSFTDISKLKDVHCKLPFLCKKYLGPRIKSSKLESAFIGNRIDISHYQFGLFDNLNVLAINFTMYSNSKPDKILNIFKHCQKLETIYLRLENHGYNYNYKHKYKYSNNILVKDKIISGIKSMSLYNAGTFGKVLDDGKMPYKDSDYIYKIIFGNVVFPNLDQLSIDSIDAKSDIDFLYDQLPMLTDLHIVENSKTSFKNMIPCSTFVHHIVTRSTRLKKFKFITNNNIDVKIIDLLAVYCNDLHFLHLQMSNGFDNELIMNLISKCKNLSRIEISCDMDCGEINLTRDMTQSRFIHFIPIISI